MESIMAKANNNCVGQKFKCESEDESLTIKGHSLGLPRIVRINCDSAMRCANSSHKTGLRGVKRTVKA